MPKIHNCRSCGSSCLVPILNLGEQPWCNNFLTKKQCGREKFYPLELVYCANCSLAQLNYTVSKETMFLNHTYVSGTTKTLAMHFKQLAQENINEFSLQPDDLILDIGGNDGTQLLQYRALGMDNLCNVESAHNIASMSRLSGLETHNVFFNHEWAKAFGRKAKLISAAGIFFHLEELHSVIRGVKELLDKDGVFVVQFMYLRDIVNNLAFDSIYHEHLCYYNLESLSNLLAPYDLVIFDARRSPIHGGSIIAKICHKGVMASYAGGLLSDDSVSLKDLFNFANLIGSRKTYLKSTLENIISSGQKVYGYGAPAKGNTLLQYFGINSMTLEKIAEVNDLKVGLYTPATHIPIVRETTNDLPDFYLVLAWNFMDEILAKNEYARSKGVKFITPFPEIKVF